MQRAMATVEDQRIKCVDCGEEFLFTVGEQAFYREKGLTHAPTRCKRCRELRKGARKDGAGAASEHAAGEHAMSGHTRGGHGAGEDPGGAARGGQAVTRGARELDEPGCANSGPPTPVALPPAAGRP